MKALSIRQPWAQLIVAGIKDIENRSWPTSCRGAFLIHTGKLDDPAGYIFANRVMKALGLPGLDVRDPDYNQLGGFIGYAYLNDCVDISSSPWFTGKYGFELTGAQPLTFYPYRGQPGFFDVPDEIAKELGL